jgi:hypothetical protein
MKENIFKFNEIKTAVYVGGYQINGRGSVENSMRFMFVKKPNIIHRFFCRILLGWVWIDNV